MMISGVSFSYGQSSGVKPSQYAEIHQTVGTANIRITYHRPNQKGRKLWGSAEEEALVPNGKVWRSGANNATVFEITEDATINGKPLPAGKYSFYTIPDTKEWTLIFNKTWDQWGTQYNRKTDALRVMTMPSMSEESKESLAYHIENVKSNSAEVILAWGKARIPFTVQFGGE
ncbi:MAG: DUF2911 domain-containing protein [Pyrinomonadaceae bacterium]|nr:DUF2911 domain-containing protein [Pyrinomonadaceae bacterium]